MNNKMDETQIIFKSSSLSKPWIIKKVKHGSGIVVFSIIRLGPNP